MELPVCENGRPAGTLRVCRRGLYTRFETLLPPGEPGALSRLWLTAGDRAAPLGLLEPTGEGRRLCRSLSRLELARLPPAPDRALVLPADAPSAALSWRSGAPSLPSSRDAERKAEDAAPAAWLRLPDGALRDPARGLLALPWAGGEPPPPARKISVDGRDYLVFRT